ncbi:hypothetical protein D3C87_1471690 [compost metagenome]
MSTLSLEERVAIAADKGAQIATEDWTGSEEGEAELGSFLDSLDVPREKED